MTPAPQHLVKLAIRLAHAQFDMRCANAAAQLLSERDGDIGALSYALLTGLAVSYARPFTDSNAYGKLEGKWSRFPNRPELRKHHCQLLDYRNTLLAHNDLSSHRATVVWTKGAFHVDRPQVVEARSPINAAGIVEVRELFTYQEKRFFERLEELIDQLQGVLGWRPGEIALERELERLVE